MHTKNVVWAAAPWYSSSLFLPGAPSLDRHKPKQKAQYIRRGNLPE